MHKHVTREMIAQCFNPACGVPIYKGEWVLHKDGATACSIRCATSYDWLQSHLGRSLLDESAFGAVE